MVQGQQMRQYRLCVDMERRESERTHRGCTQDAFAAYVADRLNTGDVVAAAFCTARWLHFATLVGSGREAHPLAVRLRRVEVLSPTHGAGLSRLYGGLAVDWTHAVIIEPDEVRHELVEQFIESFERSGNRLLPSSTTLAAGATALQLATRPATEAEIALFKPLDVLLRDRHTEEEEEQGHQAS
jgi:hypothetical protein